MFIFQTCCARVGVGVGVGVRVRVRKLFRSTSFKNSLSNKCGGDFHKTFRLSIGLCRSEKSIHKSPLLSYCGPIYPVAVWLLNLPGRDNMEQWWWTSLDKASNDTNNFRSTPFATYFFCNLFYKSDRD